MRRLAAILIIIILGLLPVFLDPYYVGLATLILIVGIFAMSLDILQGYAGMASLGHAAFWGTAAYVVGILNVKVLSGGNFAIEFIAAICAAAIVAAVLGLIVLRSKGVYFLMILLAASMMLWGVAFKWRSLTGGDDGLSGISRPVLSFIGLDLQNYTHFYYFVLFFFIVALLMMYLVVNSTFGHTLIGIRESEVRMQSLGYNIWLHKYIAFIVAGTFAGLGGTLVSYYNGFVSPSELHVVTSAEVLIMVILGGAGTLIGPAIGAAIIILIKNLASGFTEHWMIILGVIYILTVMFTPEGVYNLFMRLLKRTAIWKH
jgi:branched-chain amino acid transport system permease protein